MRQNQRDDLVETKVDEKEGVNLVIGKEGKHCQDGIQNEGLKGIISVLKYHLAVDDVIDQRRGNSCHEKGSEGNEFNVLQKEGEYQAEQQGVAYHVNEKGEKRRKEEGEKLEDGAAGVANEKSVNSHGIPQGIEMAGLVFIQINGFDFDFS